MLMTSVSVKAAHAHRRVWSGRAPLASHHALGGRPAAKVAVQGDPEGGVASVWSGGRLAFHTERLAASSPIGAASHTWMPRSVF